MSVTELPSLSHDARGGGKAAPDHQLQALLLGQGKPRVDIKGDMSSQWLPRSRNVIEVQPKKQMDRRAASPFTQMVQERTNLSGCALSEADRRVMNNPHQALHDMMRNTAKQIVDKSA